MFHKNVSQKTPKKNTSSVYLRCNYKIGGHWWGAVANPRTALVISGTDSEWNSNWPEGQTITRVVLHYEHLILDLWKAFCRDRGKCCT